MRNVKAEEEIPSDPGLECANSKTKAALKGLYKISKVFAFPIMISRAYFFVLALTDKRNWNETHRTNRGDAIARI